MEQKREPRVVRFPTDEEMKVAFEAYALALGKAIYAWNHLVEKLGDLFVVVVGDADREILLEVWNTPESDRVKIDMLARAVKAVPAGRWGDRLYKAKGDLPWLAKEAAKLIDARNNAAHAPATLWVDVDKQVMGTHPVSRHKRAVAMRFKSLFAEFEYVEKWAEGLNEFAQRAESALHPSGSYTWPERPQRPDRQPS